MFQFKCRAAWLIRIRYMYNKLILYYQLVEPSLYHVLMLLLAKLDHHIIVERSMWCKIQKVNSNQIPTKS